MSVSIIVASRILSPSDYGIYAMAAPVTGFAMLFQNIGFDHAVVQSDEVSDVQLSSLFWLNIALCLGLAMLLVAAGPVVGMFYGSSQAGVLVAVSGLLILAMAPNPLYNALLNRQMRFHAQSVIDVVSSIAMFVSTVIAALLIRSYWALLIGRSRPPSSIPPRSWSSSGGARVLPSNGAASRRWCVSAAASRSTALPCS